MFYPGCLAEGVGSILADVFGTGSGTTSMSQNIGVIAITKVRDNLIGPIGM